MNSQLFCCPGLAGLVSNAGRRGLSVLVGKTSAGLSLMLQSRSIDASDESKLVPIPFEINLTCTTGMRFCLACGFNIQDLIATDPHAFLGLADSHERFLAVSKA